MEIFKIEENDINGGSYRIYCKKLKNGSIKLKNENVLNLMKGFVKRVKENKKRTMKFINKKILQKIILCDVQKEIYPELEKALLNLLHTSGYPNIKFEKKVDFDELYKKHFN